MSLLKFNGNHKESLSLQIGISDLLNITGVLRLSGVGVLILGVMHILAVLYGEHSWQLERLFYLGLESNVPTWYSSLIMGITALGAFSCARVEMIRKYRRVWLIMGVGILFLSLDEVAMIHENLSVVLQNVFKITVIDEYFPVTNWPIMLLPIILGLAFYFVKTLETILCPYPEVRLMLYVGCFIFIFAAVGLEMTGNIIMDSPHTWLRPGEHLLEECLEMAGFLIMAKGFFLYEKNLIRKRREVL